MDMKSINSGSLRAIGYDASRRVLQVQFDDGSTLQYGGVGEATWRYLSNYILLELFPLIRRLRW